MLKATNLAEVIRNFRPNDRLDDPARLHAWFVERRGSPRKKLRISLTTQSEQQKILFVGHRGSGKTTELLKLAGEISVEFETINFDMQIISGRTAIGYEDLMRTISTQVTRECVRRYFINRPLVEPVRNKLEELREWWQRVVSGGITPLSAGEVEVGAKLNALLGDIEINVKQSSSSRDLINRQIESEMPQLISYLNWVVEQAEATAGKRLLIAVEGLDKVDLDSARDIFCNHAATITAPKATMVYTFPIPLRYSDAYNDIRMAFSSAVFYFPNMPTRHYDGTSDEESRIALHKLVLDRTEPQLIAPNALDMLVDANGGIPSTLVVLVRLAALYALERDAEQISAADAAAAIGDVRRELRAPLTSHELQVLRERHRDRRLVNDEDERMLLQKGALVDYSNGDTWCDVHPALWSLVEYDDDGK